MCLSSEHLMVVLRDLAKQPELDEDGAYYTQHV